MDRPKATSPIAIVGSSGHAKVIIDIVERQGLFEIAGLLDRFRQVGDTTLGYRVLGAEEDLPRLVAERDLSGVLIAVGDNFARARVASRVTGLCPDLPFVTVVHPMASVGRESTLGPGTVLMAGANVGPDCEIGRHCILNTHSSLDHDSVMGDFSSLAPQATTGGRCRIGDYSAISIGAVLAHDIEVGDHTVIGAGATVLQPIGSFKVAYGTPAREVRAREAGDQYL